ncbi:BQ2448_8138 [Microbotryum intermedium]|uniref:Cytoplasmic tRNA 2-thiolation protein 2 n=1 Tax=Microbotryum intermedium TaxID=269621 RepID=A0A238FMK8_9BASI|nr:BQ2448_8138 [Microbotryum intermedium]
MSTLAPTVPTKCRRCSQPAIAFVAAGSYCSSCFDSYLHSKFKRSAEGVRYFSRTGCSMDHSPLSGKQSKPRTVVQDENGGHLGAPRYRSRVLMGLSGGLGSRVLLELLKLWFPKRDPASRAPPAFEGLVVVHKVLTEELKQLVESLGIEGVRFIAVPLSDIFKEPTDPASQTPLERRRKLIQLLHSTPSATSHKAKPDHTSLETLQHFLLLTLLRRLAQQEGCEVLVTGESSDRVAELTIEGMALGRGYTIGEEVGVEWEVGTEHEGGDQEFLLVARPVSGLLRREMDEFVRVKGLVVPRPEREGERAQEGQTIQAVVGKFVKGLQKEFPNTVQTVLATVHKLGMRSTDARMRREEGEDKGQWIGCALCGGPVKEGAHQWRTAITISDLSKTQAVGSTSRMPLEEVESETSNEIVKPKVGDSTSWLDPSLCYGCLSIPRAISRLEDLPSYVQHRNSGRMEDVAKEFLLYE